MVRATRQLTCVEPSDLSSGLPPTIWYMGAKTRVLPGFLDEVLLREAPRGSTVLDLFSGTGIVSAFCARHFRTLANDSQQFARILAQSFIEHTREERDAFLESLDWDRDLATAYEENRQALTEIYAAALEEERALLDDVRGPVDEASSRSVKREPEQTAEAVGRYREFLTLPGTNYGDRDASEIFRPAQSLLAESNLEGYRNDPHRRPYCLVTAYYTNCYFGLRQAIDIDSIRAAIDAMPGHDTLWERKRAHYLAALLHTASVSTSGTSHFAQPRHIRKDSEIVAMTRRRLIDIVPAFLEASREIQQVVQSTSYRHGNQAFCGDYRELIDEESQGPVLRRDLEVELVYMDPPYTQDNYSRFYHVLETIADYDYPELERDAQGAVLRGRYPLREKRFISGFCSTRGVEEEFTFCLQAAANSGAGLVISYGSPGGLLLKVYETRYPGKDPVVRLEKLCRPYYRKVETLRRSIMHSGQGDRNIPSDELLVVCSRPK